MFKLNAVRSKIKGKKKRNILLTLNTCVYILMIIFNVFKYFNTFSR